ncbi:hypothetical protein DYBT9275_03224 [Dyadobacter sp. CECT 9275]|uniref:Repeat domain-containing protein n=1 Tax=Dyadobacter helix TaxID=2822344 RepID=A0A916JFQ9_9BACT|nr:VCBS repeat-containing protein [Dyadobacter sp. CECT 9275]CAG5003762.1 hypothetical protein DYBT9275_03224 [Dyadobacter sp. CECT 9275]
MKTIRLNVGVLIFAGFLFFHAAQGQKNSLYNNYQNGVEKLVYNNPGALVDLDVGFKSIPLPMDFDGDGDMDLLMVSTGSYAEVGVFYFENISGNVDNPIFRAGEEVYPERNPIGSDWQDVVPSEVNGAVHVLVPDFTGTNLTMYEDVPQHVFWKKSDLSVNIMECAPNGERSFWKMIDFDGDAVYDLICGTGKSVMFVKNSGTNEKPVYEKPIKITNQSGKSIAKDSYLSLETPFADYDNDGDLDYVAMTEYSNIIYSENRGTKKQYKFGEGDTLRYKGKPIQFVAKSGDTHKLRPVDFNADGFIDIVAGDQEGKVSFLKNTGKIVNGAPEFMPPVFFQQEAKYVDMGAHATPRVFDWDGDGLDDIVSGNNAGFLVFLKNLGGYMPKWDTPKYLEIDGTPIRFLQKEYVPGTEHPQYSYTNVVPGDWDMDGLPDLLVNDHSGNVMWLKNKGSRTKPKLSQPQGLEVNWEGKPLEPKWVPGYRRGNELLAPWRTTPYIMDFDEDGLNDLVMLDYEGYLAVYPRSKKEGKLLLGHPQRNFIFPDGTPIRLNQLEGKSNGRMKIIFADWDGDGLKDLIFSHKPAASWMKNKGTKDGKMILQYMGRVVSRSLMGHDDCPVVSDFNKDGVPDLLVGTETGVLYYWQRPSFDITTTMTTSGKQTPTKHKYFKR